eukprot:6181069-Pleurochrysis_carterae.AAC.2
MVVAFSAAFSICCWILVVLTTDRARQRMCEHSREAYSFDAESTPLLRQGQTFKGRHGVCCVGLPSGSSRARSLVGFQDSLFDRCMAIVATSTFSRKADLHPRRSFSVSVQNVSMIPRPYQGKFGILCYYSVFWPYQGETVSIKAVEYLGSGCLMIKLVKDGGNI